MSSDILRVVEDWTRVELDVLAELEDLTEVQVDAPVEAEDLEVDGFLQWIHPSSYRYTAKTSNIIWRIIRQTGHTTFKVTDDAQMKVTEAYCVFK
jgi:hypothetical protein